MENKDKVLFAVGGGLLIVAGIIIWKKNQTANDAANDAGGQYIDQPTQPAKSEPVKIPVKTADAPTKISAVIPDGFSYRVGQRVMANVRPNVPVQDVFLKADGEYSTNGKNVDRFEYGKEIGVIKWIGKRPDGTYRYVVARKTLGLFEQLYWVNHKHVKPVGPIIPPAPTVRNLTGLNLDLLLHRGVYNSKEVAELQKRLGIAADGDFGQNTENALLAKKGVKEIKLKNF